MALVAEEIQTTVLETVSKLRGLSVVILVPRNPSARFVDHFFVLIGSQLGIERLPKANYFAAWKPKLNWKSLRGIAWLSTS